MPSMDDFDDLIDLAVAEDIGILEPEEVEALEEEATGEIHLWEQLRDGNPPLGNRTGIVDTSDG